MDQKTLTFQCIFLFKNCKMENFIKEWFATVNTSRNILFNAPQFACGIENLGTGVF